MYLLVQVFVLCGISLKLTACHSCPARPGTFKKTTGLQYNVLQKVPRTTELLCPLPCHLHSDCVGFDFSHGLCNLYKDQTNTSLEPATIWMVVPYDCSLLRSNGVRSLRFKDGTPYSAYCEDDWTFIMRHTDASQDFNLDWKDYKHGFGNLSKDFWIGNEILHKLTDEKKYRLKLEFTYWSTQQSYFSEYEQFNVDSEDNMYKLDVTGYAGNNGLDPLGYQNGAYFSTRDKDHDTHSGSCAQTHHGGFWYMDCAHLSPTSLHQAYLGNHDCMWVWDGTDNYCMSYFIIKMKPQ